MDAGGDISPAGSLDSAVGAAIAADLTRISEATARSGLNPNNIAGDLTLTAGTVPMSAEVDGLTTLSSALLDRLNTQNAVQSLDEPPRSFIDRTLRWAQLTSPAVAFSKVFFHQEDYTLVERQISENVRISFLESQPPQIQILDANGSWTSTDVEAMAVGDGGFAIDMAALEAVTGLTSAKVLGSNIESFPIYDDPGPNHTGAAPPSRVDGDIVSTPIDVLKLPIHTGGPIREDPGGNVVSTPMPEFLWPDFVTMAGTRPDGKPYRRPHLRNDTIDSILGSAPKTDDGEYINPHDGKPIANGQEVFGHKYGREHWRLTQEAEQMGLTQQEFNDWINSHPDWFQVEDKADNQSHQFEKPKGE